MENALITMPDMERAAGFIAKSGLFGVKTIDQAMALMLVAQAEGRNPYEAARDYHIIQNRPSLKADAVLARFQQAGGTVEWVAYTDSKVIGKFTHAQGGTVTIDWTIDKASKIVQQTRDGLQALTDKDNWKNYPRAMLRARCISEGVRTVFPGVCSGTYTKEEIEDMSPESLKPEMEVINPEDSKKAEGQTTIIEPAKTLSAENPIGSPSQESLRQRARDIQAALKMPDDVYVALLCAHGAKIVNGKPDPSKCDYAGVVAELVERQRALTPQVPEIPGDVWEGKA